MREGTAAAAAGLRSPTHDGRRRRRELQPWRDGPDVNGEVRCNRSVLVDGLRERVGARAVLVVVLAAAGEEGGKKVGKQGRGEGG